MGRLTEGLDRRAKNAKVLGSIPTLAILNVGSRFFSPCKNYYVGMKGWSGRDNIFQCYQTSGRWRSWLSHLSNTTVAQKVLSSSLGRLIFFYIVQIESSYLTFAEDFAQEVMSLAIPQ